MIDDPLYSPSIPETAKRGKIRRGGHGTTSADYEIDGEVVGFRTWDADGVLTREVPGYRRLVDEQEYWCCHGIEYDSHFCGRVCSITPWEHGRVHGTASQYSQHGLLIGTYTMEHGTGVDLWWQPIDDDGHGPFALNEVWPQKNGLPHGQQIMLWGDHSFWREEHWLEGEKHGIFREWDLEGKLENDHPHFYVHDQRVSKEDYIQSQADDPTLPRYRFEEDVAQRPVPEHLKPYLLVEGQKI